jgi:hypothetical protein
LAECMACSQVSMRTSGHNTSTVLFYPCVYETRFAAPHPFLCWLSLLGETTNIHQQRSWVTLQYIKSGQACAWPLDSWPLPCIQRKGKPKIRSPHGLVQTHNSSPRVQTHNSFLKCNTEFDKGSCIYSTVVPVPQLHPKAPFVSHIERPCQQTHT